MAAIISVQTATKEATPSPIVPVIPVTPRAIATVVAHAPAASTSSTATQGDRTKPSARGAAPELVILSPGPGERRGETALPLPPPLDPERGQPRHTGRRDRQRGVRRMEHVRQLDRVKPLASDEILHGHAGCVPDGEFVAAPVLAVADARPFHAEHLADQRPEHGRRPARLTGQHDAELG